MKRKSRKRMIATVMTVIMILMVSAPSLAGTLASGPPIRGDDFGKRNITDTTGLNARIGSDSDQILDEDDVEDDKPEDDKPEDDASLPKPTEETLQANTKIVGNTSAQIEYTVDGKKKDSISFYIKRDPSTNKAITPNPVMLRITQTEGEAIGPIQVSVGVPDDRIKD